MKSFLKYTLAITITLFSFTTGHSQFKRVKGNGNVTEKTHNTADYNKIDVVGSMDVKLVTGTEGTIKVVTDENIQEYIIIDSKNGTLTIKSKKGVNISTKKGIHITVPFKDISEIALTGSGDVLTSNAIKSNHFDVELTGSGDIVIEVEATSIDAKITGSGDIKLRGKVTDLEVKVTGSGDFTGKSLVAQNTQAYVSGSGDAVVYASKTLKARVNGSGDIIYYGKPEKTDTKVMGSGDIVSN